MIEADVKQLPRLLDAIQRPVGYAVQADISRVSSLERFDAKNRLRMGYRTGLFMDSDVVYCEDLSALDH
ncbi:hypothetical protein GFM09_28600 [Rhizobium leguminosarum bv. viciae]|uniref:hypothetical protein n=1 Tax=Rhizobium leguminosarum TaxID=384 RepID=UPI001441E26C|nr:hypothetical protein [Rhizobium leguminosarum]NKL73151.1 hypothetical protein [Rhizobium leguminosarum bv. viciae]